MKTRTRSRLKIPFPALLVLAVIGINAGCSLYRLEKDLPPAYAAFLSEVRYLITSAERKTFLSSPDSAKDRLIEEFWKRRDPQPSTSENELKTEYYARIAQADDLFKTDTPRGWLSERGRIYVLYGPPSERRTMNFTETATSNRLEVWYYGAYALTFRDVSGTGSFRLDTTDLSAIQDLNIARVGVSGPSGSFRGFGPGGRFALDAQPMLDFSVELRNMVRHENRIEGTIHLEIPLRLIWFKSEGRRFLTTFDVVVRVKDSRNAVVWEKTTSAEAAYAETEIARSDRKHMIDIPVLIEEAEVAAKLAAPPVTVLIRLTNRTGSETLEKTAEWK
jgi:GWxTD domain-containing protein